MAALANSSTELSAGQTLDRYELVYPIAQGGMARVWVAKLRGKHGFEKMVALKTILPTFAENQRFRRMFLDEAKIASGIEHVNVAQILDLGEQDGQLYLVMEWVDGDSLQELDRAAERVGASLPIPVLIRVIADVCAGLHAAHELTDARGQSLNVVHRDVSPQNVLISAKGVVKVIDFGVVKARRRTTEETNTGTIKGKLLYMAPEQALGHCVDRRADIWAVGAILYRLLARRHVYGGTSPLSRFKRLTSSVPPAPLPAHVPVALSNIVARALAFEPERRFSTAAELGVALEALLYGPYQTTAREVASTMQQYLGDALSARRSAIVEALGGARPMPAGGSPIGADRESGISQAETWPQAPSSAPSSQPPTVVDTRQRVAMPDDDTRSLQPGVGQPTRASLPSKWIAAGGVVAFSAALAWSCLSSNDSSRPSELPSRVAAALSQMAGPTLLTPAEPVPAAVPRAEPALVPATPVAALPTLEETPLSVHALPVLAERTKPASVAKATRHRPPVPRVVQLAPRAAAPAASPSPAPASVKPKRKVVDDGF